ncbi:hypothetical protein AGMMS49975_04100 [Clostridia bacterium]|nr:hypothetical protein AGMMS49975_04100 [Clostridia bacterium]
MKKKIAILLAATMTVSLLPVNVFAYTTQAVDQAAATMPGKTVYIEKGNTTAYNAETDAGFNATKIDKKQTSGGENDAEYYSYGSNLILDLKSNILAGESFDLTLNNAEWLVPKLWAKGTWASQDHSYVVSDTTGVGYSVNFYNTKTANPPSLENGNFNGLLLTADTSRPNAYYRAGTYATNFNATNDLQTVLARGWAASPYIGSNGGLTTLASGTTTSANFSTTDKTNLASTGGYIDVAAVNADHITAPTSSGFGFANAIKEAFINTYYPAHSALYDSSDSTAAASGFQTSLAQIGVLAIGAGATTPQVQAVSNAAAELAVEQNKIDGSKTADAAAYEAALKSLVAVNNTITSTVTKAGTASADYSLITDNQVKQAEAAIAALDVQVEKQRATTELLKGLYNNLYAAVDALPTAAKTAAATEIADLTTFNTALAGQYTNIINAASFVGGALTSVNNFTQTGGTYGTGGNYTGTIANGTLLNNQGAAAGQGNLFSSRIEVPYILTFDPARNDRATVTVLAGTDEIRTTNALPNEPGGNSGAATVQYAIVVPIVAYVDTDKVASITTATSGSSVITAATTVFAQAANAATKFTIRDPQTSHETFPIKSFSIEETRPGSLKSHGTFSLELPAGFNFIADANYGGTTARTNSNPYSASLTTNVRPSAGNLTKDPNYTTGTWSQDALLYDLYQSGVVAGNKSTVQLANNRTVAVYDVNPALISAGGYISAYGFSENRVKIDRAYFLASGTGYDTSRLYIQYADLTPTNTATGTRGALTFIGGTLANGTTDFSKNIGLAIRADEGAAAGDFNIHIVDGDPTGSEDYNAGVTDEYTKAGTKANWDIKLTATSAPTLYNGLYEVSGQSTSYHKAAEVSFEELLPNAWLSNRKTQFTLPEGVKIAKAEISDVDGVAEDEHLKGSYSLAVNDKESVVRSSNGFVTLTEDELSISGIDQMKTITDTKAKFKLKLWLTIAPDVEGDINLTLKGTGVTEEQKVLIAKAANPITVTPSEVSDIKIGYQNQVVSDFTITEAKAGTFRKNDLIKVSITDGVQSDISFTGFNASVTDGDLKIKNQRVASYGSTWAQSPTLGSNGESGTISFEIDSASSKPSTVKFTNVQIKIDRTIPETNKTPYKLVVWGDIARDYDSTSNPAPATHRVPGYQVDYLRVATSAESIDNLNAEVRVSIGSESISINGKETSIDTAAFIDPDSNSTLVPVRFVSTALLSAETTDKANAVQWDNEARTVTIYNGSRIIQFAIGSDQIIVNGVGSTMYSPDGLPVKAVIRDERAFIPFRALGTALGVTVAWDADTQTAIYNPKATDDSVAE